MNPRPPRWTLPRPGRIRGTVRSRFGRPMLPDALVDEVLGRYGLRRTGSIRNLAMTWRNPIVVVPTEAATVVVKQHRSTTDAASLEVEHSILGHLETVGFPAVRLATASDGTTVVTVGGTRYVVSDLVPGRQLTGRLMTTRQRESVWRTTGRTLGRLHGALEGFVPSGRHRLGIDPGSGSANRDLAWYLGTLQELGAEPASSPDDAAGLEPHLPWLRDELISVGELIASVDLPGQVVHGDFGTHNLLFGADGTVTVHDFELARFDWRLLDLVIAGLRAPVGPRRWLVEGYREVVELTPTEERHLTDLVRYHLLGGAVRSWEGYRALGGDERLRTARIRVERLRSDPSTLEAWA